MVGKDSQSLVAFYFEFHVGGTNLDTANRIDMVQSVLQA